MNSIRILFTCLLGFSVTLVIHAQNAEITQEADTCVIKMKCVWAYHVAHDTKDSTYIMQNDIGKIFEIKIVNKDSYGYDYLSIKRNFANYTKNYIFHGEKTFFKREATDDWLHYIYCSFTERFDILEWHQHEATNMRYLWDDFLYFVKDLSKEPFQSKNDFIKWEKRNNLSLWTEYKEIPCSSCNGTGSVKPVNKSEYICRMCDGNGMIHITKNE